MEHILIELQHDIVAILPGMVRESNSIVHDLH